MVRLIFGFLVLLTGLLASPALANDSAAEVAVGGLTLTQSKDVSLDKEDLYISQDEVRVDYLFTNHADHDIETLVAFPLPDQVFDAESGEGPSHRLAQDLDFKTTVDGQPVSYDVVEQAIKNGKDVTAQLAAAGLNVIAPEDNDKAIAFFKAKPASVLDGLVKAGLVQVEKSEDTPYYTFMWDVRTSVTRKQVFAAGKTVAVHHTYKPVSGGSVAGNLAPDVRNAGWAKTHFAQYCVDKGWFKAFDKALHQHQTSENTAPYSEVWLGYVLKSGANWKGPIKDFRMVVDKGKAENLVSFCAESVKKISDTQFEVVKKNFEPKADLLVLIVNWWKPE
jgi:Domain of unknown function (DUF4424)